jgi:hypothetical protein
MANPMPTGAKAMAAITFAIVSWIVANLYAYDMPEAGNVGLFREMSAGLGAIIGWQVMGNSVGKGYIKSIGSGWKTMIVLIVFALLLFAIYEMLQLSVKMRYDGPQEAILDVFQRMMDRGLPILQNVQVIAAILIGGGIAGLLTENASRRWR